MPTVLRRFACRKPTLFFAALLWAFTAAGFAHAADGTKKTDAPKADAKPGARGAKGAKAGARQSAASHGDAQKAEPKAEPVDPSKDPGFVLQGEYVGPVAVAPGKYEPLALQVRPIGQDGFEAVQYRGGLPGERAHREPAITLIGKRSDGFLVLSGGPWAVFVQPDHCLLVDRQGHPSGRLERVSRESPTLGAQPPKEAVVLFSGKDTDQLVNGRMTADGLLMEGADARPMFQDFNLHAEFLLPYMPAGRDQGRGNSGIYLLSRYEVQILDSFAQEPVFNGCGSLYRFRKPDVNMCLPPQVWQTYDIAFTAPRWASDNTKLKDARITVWLNGVKVHDNVELADKTGAGKPEEPTLLPIKFQDHKNPVRFRNIWIIDRGAAPAAHFPVLAGTSAPEKKPAAKAAPKTAPKEPSISAAAGDKKPEPADAQAKPSH